MYIYPLEKTRAATACAGPLPPPHFGCATAEGPHTEDSVVTDAVFQPPMFALKADA